MVETRPNLPRAIQTGAGKRGLRTERTQQNRKSIIINHLKAETMKRIDYKEVSKGDWGRNPDPKKPDSEKTTWEDVQKGLMLRAVEAMELMAKNHRDLQAEATKYKLLAMQNAKRAEALENQLRTRKGVANRYKRERDELRQQLEATQ